MYPRMTISAADNIHNPAKLDADGNPELIMGAGWELGDHHIDIMLAAGIQSFPADITQGSRHIGECEIYLAPTRR